VKDKQLIEQFNDGDIEAFNQIVARWQERIHRLAYRYFASYDEAVEITQKTFIKVYHNIESLEDYSKFPAWIYRISNNLCLDEVKRAGRKKARPLEALKTQRAALDAAADRAIHEKELGSILQQALKQLPHDQRIVVIMKEYQGLTFREIAEILEENENTIKSRMYYGLRSMKTIFKQWNIEMEELL